MERKLYYLVIKCIDKAKCIVVLTTLLVKHISDQHDYFEKVYYFVIKCNGRKQGVWLMCQLVCFRSVLDGKMCC